MKMIPKLIHLVFLSKTEEYPKIFSRCIARIKELHPNWVIIIYNEDDAVEVIRKHAPYLLPIYNGYGHLVQRADMFRMLILYLFGGFYMDMDMFCLQPMDNLRKYSLVLAIEKVITEEQRVRLQLSETVRIANYMFGSVPEHPFWLSVILESLNFCHFPVTSENDILESTGPGLLSNYFGRHSGNFPDIHLLPNTMDCAVEKQLHKKSCFFGEFAAHLHQGTWRWQKVTSLPQVGSKIDLAAIKKAKSLIQNNLQSMGCKMQ